MNYKGLLVTNAFSLRESAKYQKDQIIKEFKKLNIDVFHVTNIEILSYIEDGKIIDKYSPKEFDFVIYLDKDKYISKMLEKSGFILFNSADAIELCDDKMLTHIYLANHGIKMPTTISYPLCYIYNNDDSYLNEVYSKLSFPFVLKENYGSLGNQVYFVENKDELLELEEKLRFKPHLYQEYIEGSYGVDYRIFVIGGEVVASMKRMNPNNFRANIAQGGKGYPYNPSKEMIDIALKSALYLGLDYCAIDFVINSNNEPILVEINSNAFFSEIERISGVNIAKHYVDYIYKKVYLNQTRL